MNEPAGTPRRIVVFRHGILLNRWVMEPLARYLRKRGFEVRNASYPTTRKRIREHAEDLAEELCDIARTRSAGGPYELFAVTHSMGGLVLRYALTHFEVPPLRRAVLIVPPNQGSQTARYFRDFPPYRWLFGRKAGAELASDPPGIFAECGIPAGVEIGIIAGKSRFKLYPVPLPVPNDGIVAVSEMVLDEAPLTILPYGHTPILFHRRTWRAVAEFLELGRFPEET